MKNLFIILTLMLVTLISCNESQINPDVYNSDSSKTVHVFNLSGNDAGWTAVSLDELPTRLNYANKKSKQKFEAKGEYHGYGGTAAITFKGKHKDNKTKGSARFQQTLNLPFPPFAGFVDVIMEAECLVVDGNEAVYGGLMTDVLDNGGFPPGGPFTVGNYFYFKVKDNGKGSKDPLDQYSGSLVITPVPSPDCMASFAWGPFLDVDGEDDKIKIKGDENNDDDDDDDDDNDD